MRLAGNDGLDTKYLTVFDKVEDKAMIVKDRHCGSWVPLEFLLLGLIDSVVEPVRLPLKFPIIEYILIEGLFLEFSFDFMVVVPVVLEGLVAVCPFNHVPDTRLDQLIDVLS